MTPDRFIPGIGPAIQSDLELNQIPCLDIRAACCNLLYALQLARSLVVSGAAKNVAIALAEIQSVWLDLTPGSATTSMLFGDGASALVVSDSSVAGALEIVDLCIGTDGAYIDDLGIRRPGTEYGPARAETSNHLVDYYPRMIGQSVILQASRRMVSACETVLSRNGLKTGDVGLLIPHQANANLLTQVAKNLRIDSTRIVSVIEEFGNTSSASMGIALDTARRTGRIEGGQNLLLPAFGAGFTWGAGLCKAV
jgi:3-oxoacyl-[acyl-carrier-protein] synthase-3